MIVAPLSLLCFVWFFFVWLCGIFGAYAIGGLFNSKLNVAKFSRRSAWVWIIPLIVFIVSVKNGA